MKSRVCISRISQLTGRMSVIDASNIQKSMLSEILQLNNSHSIITIKTEKVNALIKQFNLKFMKKKKNTYGQV